MNEVIKNIPVLQIVSSYYPIIGGAERATGTLSKGLNQQNSTSHVLTRWYPNLKRNEIIDGVSVTRLGLSGPFKLGALTFAIHCILWIIIYGKSYKIIHTQNMDTPLLVAFITKILTKKKWVVTIHGEWHLPTRIATRIGKIRVAIMCYFAEKYVSISEANRVSMLKVGIKADQIASIPNSIDTTHMRPATAKEKLELRKRMNYAEDETIVLFLARLVYRKRPDLLIKAFSRLDIPKIRCIVAGDGEESENLEKLVNDLNLGSQVELVGPVHNVRDYFWLSDIYVLPSQYEGLPVALLESMACGKSIVVSRCDGNLQAIEDNVNGITFEVDNEDHLTSQLSKLIADPILQKKLGDSAEKTILNLYSMESVAKQHLVLYREVLDT